MKPASSLQEHDLEWADRPTSALTTLAGPMLVSMVSFAAMNLVDTLVVGRLGASALAAVGLGSVTSFVVLCFAFGLFRGTKVLVSQAVGANRRDELPATLAAAVVVAVGFGIAGMALGEILAGQMIRVAPGDASARLAADYLRVRLAAAPADCLFFALREYRYGLGDTRGPMHATLVGNGVNAVLDPLFVFGLEMGVAGAALGTALGHLSELVVLGTRQVRAEGWPTPAIAGRRHYLALLRLGLPTGVQFSLEVGAFAAMTALIAGMGEVAMAAHQVSLQIVHFAFLPTVAFADAASVLAGQAVGARRDELVVRVSVRAFAVAAAYAGTCGLVFLLAGDLLALPFAADPAVRRSAAGLLVIGAAFQVSDAGVVVARGVLRGTGDVRFPAVIGVLGAWLLTPPITWALGYGLGWGVRGAWFALTADLFLAAAVLWWRLLGGHWQSAARESRRRLEEETRVELPPRDSTAPSAA